MCVRRMVMVGCDDVVSGMMLCRFRHVSFVGEFFQFPYSNISINKQIINLNNEMDGDIFLISRRQTSVLNDMQ